MDYIKKQNLIIDEVIKLTKKAKSRKLLKGVMNLTEQFALNAKDFPDTVDGMVGFIQWAKDNDQEKSLILTTLLHDLSAFVRHRMEVWYCPRTYDYAKYIKE